MMRRFLKFLQGHWLELLDEKEREGSHLPRMETSEDTVSKIIVVFTSGYFFFFFFGGGRQNSGITTHHQNLRARQTHQTEPNKSTRSRVDPSPAMTSCPTTKEVANDLAQDTDSILAHRFLHARNADRRNLGGAFLAREWAMSSTKFRAAPSAPCLQRDHNETAPFGCDKF